VEGILIKRKTLERYFSIERLEQQAHQRAKRILREAEEEAKTFLALGMTHWQSMKLIILPQAFRAMVPLLLTQGIVLFQDTSLVY
ncbi:hypothetical protein MJM04_30660, partial [Salmonella enterica subsp. enterica serovar Cerro]|nr:hypothetical protein [Salmonella enterica subsp. enterica serovar Cerro]